MPTERGAQAPCGAVHHACCTCGTAHAALVALVRLRGACALLLCVLGTPKKLGDSIAVPGRGVRESKLVEVGQGYFQLIVIQEPFTRIRMCAQGACKHENTPSTETRTDAERV